MKWIAELSDLQSKEEKIRLLPEPQPAFPVAKNQTRQKISDLKPLSYLYTITPQNSSH